MIKLLRLVALKPAVFILLLTWGAAPWANEAENEVAINIALETAQAHTPGKVITHEKAHVMATDNTQQPVYRIKILNDQGVMKTLLVNRKTGLVIE